MVGSVSLTRFDIYFSARISDWTEIVSCRSAAIRCPGSLYVTFHVFFGVTAVISMCTGWITELARHTIFFLHL